MSLRGKNILCLPWNKRGEFLPVVSSAAAQFEGDEGELGVGGLPAPLCVELTSSPKVGTTNHMAESL